MTYKNVKGKMYKQVASLKAQRPKSFKEMLQPLMVNHVPIEVPLCWFIMMEVI
jgi:hypothetical protein